ncbi:MAG TPA: hypothetical protein VGA01_00730 [Candidatus Binatia bacterium]
MSISRREMCMLLPALLPVAVELNAFAAQDNALSSGVFAFDNAPLHVANNNVEVRLMFRGKLATGEGVEVHEDDVAPPAARPPQQHITILIPRCGSSVKDR